MDIDCDFVDSEAWVGNEMDGRLKWLRENDPVYWSEKSGLWMITGYRDAEFISKHQEIFTSEFGIRPGTDILAGRPAGGALLPCTMRMRIVRVCVRRRVRVRVRVRLRGSSGVRFRVG